MLCLRICKNVNELFCFVEDFCITWNLHCLECWIESLLGCLGQSNCPRIVFKDSRTTTRRTNTSFHQYLPFADKTVHSKDCSLDQLHYSSTSFWDISHSSTHTITFYVIYLMFEFVCLVFMVHCSCKKFNICCEKIFLSCLLLIHVYPEHRIQ